MKVVAVIHAYPSIELLHSLSQYKVHLFVPVHFEIKDISEMSNITIHKIQLAESNDCIERIYEIVKEFKIEVFLPFYEGSIVLSAIVSEKAGLYFYSVPTAMASRNKYYLGQIMRLYGVPVPNVVPAYKFTPYSYLQKRLGKKFILKIVDSMNSKSVMLINDENEYNNKIYKMYEYLEDSNVTLETDRNKFCYGKDELKVIAQEFCDGGEINLDVLICNAKKYTLGIFQKEIAEGPYFPETMSFYPSDLDEADKDNITEYAKMACDALKLQNGIVHLEFRYKDGEPCLLDMGLRPGGAYTVRAVNEIFNIDIFNAVAKIFTDFELDFSNRINDIAILYGGIVFRKTGYIREIEGIDLVDQIGEIREIRSLVEVGSYVVAPPFSAQPHLCYYYMVGNSIDSLKNIHYNIQRIIKVTVDGKEQK